MAVSRVRHYHAAMAVTIDQVHTELSGETLGEVVAAAQERLGPAGRVIVEVIVDGQSVIGDDLADRQHEAVGDHQVELLSASPRDLSMETLSQIRAQLDEMRQTHEQIAEYLQQDQPADALKQLGDLLQQWQFVQQAVVQTSSMMDLSLEDLTLADKQLIEHVDGLRDQLVELRTMLSNGDLVSLADAMAYEWPGTVDQWDGVLADLHERIAQLPQA